MGRNVEMGSDLVRLTKTQRVILATMDERGALPKVMFGGRYGLSNRAVGELHKRGIVRLVIVEGKACWIRA